MTLAEHCRGVLVTFLELTTWLMRVRLCLHDVRCALMSDDSDPDDDHAAQAIRPARMRQAASIGARQPVPCLTLYLRSARRDTPNAQDGSSSLTSYNYNLYVSLQATCQLRPRAKPKAHRQETVHLPETGQHLDAAREASYTS